MQWTTISPSLPALEKIIFFFFLQTGIVDVEIGKEKVARHSAHFNLLAFLRYDSDV